MGNTKKETCTIKEIVFVKDEQYPRELVKIGKHLVGWINQNEASLRFYFVCKDINYKWINAILLDERTSTFKNLDLAKRHIEDVYTRVATSVTAENVE